MKTRIVTVDSNRDRAVQCCFVLLWVPVACTQLRCWVGVKILMELNPKWSWIKLKLCESVSGPHTRGFPLARSMSLSISLIEMLVWDFRCNTEVFIAHIVNTHWDWFYSSFIYFLSRQWWVFFFFLSSTFATLSPSCTSLLRPNALSGVDHQRPSLYSGSYTATWPKGTHFLSELENSFSTRWSSDVSVANNVTNLSEF